MFQAVACIFFFSAAAQDVDIHKLTLDVRLLSATLQILNMCTVFVEVVSSTQMFDAVFNEWEM